MADSIRSNLIIDAKVEANRKGFGDMALSLKNLKSSLEAITKKEYVINLKLADADVKAVAANLTAAMEAAGKRAAKEGAKAIKSEAKKSAKEAAAEAAREFAAGTGSYASGSSSGFGANQTTKQEKVRESAKGTLTEHLEIHREILGTIEQQTKLVTQYKDGLLSANEVIEKQNDIVKDTIRTEQKRRVQQATKANFTSADIRANEVRSGQRINELLSNGFTENVAGLKTKSRMLANGEEIMENVREFRREAGNGLIEVQRINTALDTTNQFYISNRERAKEVTKLQNEKNAEIREQLKNEAKVARYHKEEVLRQGVIKDAQATLNKLKDRGYEITNKKVVADAKGAVRGTEYELRRDTGIGDGSEYVIRLNSMTNTLTAVRDSSKAITQLQKEKNAEIREQLKNEAKIARNHKEEVLRQGVIKDAQATLNKLKERGFELANKKVIADAKGTVRGAEYELRRDTGRGDGSQHVIRLNSVTNTLTASRWQDIHAAKAQQKQERMVADAYRESIDAAQGRALASERIAAAQNSGFRKGAMSRQYDAVKKTSSTWQEFYKTTRVGMAKYEVALQRINLETGRVVSETLHGAKAARFLGDSIGMAAQKVLLWTAGTTVIIGGIRAIRNLLNAVKQLEANTILMARVWAIDMPFEQRFKEAQMLTQGIVELSASIGADAIAAQRAAAVFLRTGQSRQDVLTSVKASLLAARVAELEVEDAANLLSAAYLQFNLAATDLLPTLDSLNNLSNSYKVTTDDLLQSISRAGSVFADHNGRLEELAAITAIVGQTTSRTGTQIGNAVKTIQSRLDRFEVRQDLFKSMGISTLRLDGSAKSLSETLVELKIGMDSLSESEKKSTTLQVAGVRQRNILVAAVENAIQVLEAENKAYKEANSATVEFEDQSKTLESALARLKETLNLIAQDASGPLQILLKDLVNLATAILKATTIMGGLPLKLAIWASSIYLVRKALSLLGGRMGVNVTHAANLGKSWRVLGLQTRRLHLRLMTLKRTMGLAGAAGLGMRKMFGGLKAALGGLLSPLNVATLVIGFIAHALAQAAETQMRYTNALQTEREQIEANLSLQRKRIETFESQARSIAKVIAQMEILEEQNKNTAQARKRLQEIAAATGFKVDPNAPTSVIRADLARQELDEKRKLYAEEMRLSKERQTNLKKQQDEALKEGHKKMKELVKYGDDALAAAAELAPLEALYEAGKWVVQGIGGWFGGDGYWENRAEAARALRKEIDVLLEKQRELGNQIETEAEKERIAAEALDSLINKYKAIQRAIIDFSRTTAMIEKFRKGQGVSEQITAQLYAGNRPISEDKRQLAELEKITMARARQVRFFSQHKAYEDQAVELQKELNNLLAEQLQLRAKIAKAQISASTEMAKGIYERRGRLSESFGLERLRQRNILSDRGREAGGIDEIAFKQQSALDRLRANRSDAARARARLAAGGLTGLQKVGEIGRARAAEEDAAKNLNTLRDLELQKVEAIMRAETAVVEQRKKSADEAARALGILSEEDKLRVRAQAAYFRSNPGKILNASDLFAGDSKGVQLATQFFNGRVNPTSGLPGFIRGSGFGTDFEVEKSAADIAAYRGGRTDHQLASGALDRANRADYSSRALTDDAVRGTARFESSDVNIRQDKTGTASPSVELQVTNDTFNLAPIVTQLDNVVTKILEHEIPLVYAEVGRIIDAKFITSTTKRAPTP